MTSVHLTAHATEAFSILPISAASWSSHTFHGSDRVWPETNCYVDLWIELLKALGADPVAALGFTIGIDFEGDQWTFFKFPLEDLRSLFGIEVQEYAIWRAMPDHLLEQAARNRFLIIEVDSWYLPDTAGVSYRKAHNKTSIAINTFDLTRKTLGYFHGSGYFEANGEDVDGLLRLGSPARWSDDVLAPYVEVVKVDRQVRRSNAELRALATGVLSEHLARRTDHDGAGAGAGAGNFNAMARFLERFSVDVHTYAASDLAAFHRYAFATLRQIGAASELAGDHIRWLLPDNTGFNTCADHFLKVSTSAKALQFKLARLAAGRSTDLSETMREMQKAWSNAFSMLTHLLSAR
jgi:hypothetical protein